MYDYHEMNMEKYQDKEPPRYPVEKITAPITFIYSTKDRLVGVEVSEKASSDEGCSKKHYFLQ